MNEREKQILELMDRGMNARQIGLAIGATKDAVTGVMTRMRNRFKAAAKPPKAIDRSIMALTSVTCRYPFGDVRKGGVTYCCAPVEHPGVDVYCREHALKCYQSPEAYRRATATALRRAGVID